MSKIMLDDNKTDIIEKGFSVIPGVFEREGLNAIPQLIDQADSSRSSFNRELPGPLEWAERIGL